MVIFAKTVQRKLLLLLLTVGMVPAAIGILHTYYGINVGFSQVLEDLVRDEAQQSARRLDEILAAELGSARQAQAALASIYQEDRTTTGLLDDIRAQLASLTIKNESIAAAAWWLAPDGSVLAMAERDSIPSDRRTVTSDGMSLEIPKGLWAGKLPRMFISEATSSRGAVLRLFLAVESADSGTKEKPTVLVVDLAARDILNRLRGPSAGAELRILSNRGSTIIAGTGNERLAAAFRDNSDIFEQYLGSLSVLGTEQSSFVTGFSSSRFLTQHRLEGRTSVAWLVLSSVDLDEARTIGSFLLWRSILFGIVLVPFLIILSTVMAQRFLRPLRMIHASINRLAEGYMGGKVSIRTGDEFEDLAEAYNRMAERIRQASSELLSQIRSSRRQAREVTLVHDVCQSLAAEFDRDRLFETARKRLTEILRHDCLTAVVADPAGHSTLHHFSGGAIRTHIPASDVLRFCQTSIRDWASSRARPSGTFLTPHGSFSGTGMPNPDCHELAILPLLAGEILLGAIILGRMSPEPFNEEELEATKPIARFLAVATEHIQLYERTVNFASELEATVRARTEQLEAAHRQLLMTERFAATGKLAANIAHEINNPLGIIKNYLRIHRDSLNDSLSPDSAEALNVMEEELDRIARIVRRLLDFYRPPSMEPTPTDINSEIRTILSLMGSTLQHKGIHVELQLDESLPKVMLVPDLLRQVILNICKNAEEAMEGSGTLLLVTSMDRSADPPCVRLEIADTGCGIPPEHLGQIFEPFFTSKSEGQGTGLGLAVTYGILRGMGGTIHVESNVGLGTRFIITIPISKDQQVEACEAPAPTSNRVSS